MSESNNLSVLPHFVVQSQYLRTQFKISAKNHNHRWRLNETRKFAYRQIVYTPIMYSTLVMYPVISVYQPYVYIYLASDLYSTVYWSNKISGGLDEHTFPGNTSIS